MRLNIKKSLVWFILVFVVLISAYVVYGQFLPGQGEEGIPVPPLGDNLPCFSDAGCNVGEKCDLGTHKCFVPCTPNSGCKVYEKCNTFTGKCYVPPCTFDMTYWVSKIVDMADIIGVSGLKDIQILEGSGVHLIASLAPGSDCKGVKFEIKERGLLLWSTIPLGESVYRTGDEFIGNWTANKVGTFKFNVIAGGKSIGSDNLLYVKEKPECMIDADCGLGKKCVSNFCKDCLNDADCDGILNSQDNCLYVANPDQMNIDINKENIMLKGSLKTSNSFSNYLPGNVVDGSLKTGWGGIDAKRDGWLEVDFGKIEEINKIIVIFDENFVKNAKFSFSLYTFNDGTGEGELLRTLSGNIPITNEFLVLARTSKIGISFKVDNAVIDDFGKITIGELNGNILGQGFSVISEIRAYVGDSTGDVCDAGTKCGTDAWRCGGYFDWLYNRTLCEKGVCSETEAFVAVGCESDTDCSEGQQCDATNNCVVVPPLDGQLPNGGTGGDVVLPGGDGPGSGSTEKDCEDIKGPGCLVSVCAKQCGAGETCPNSVLVIAKQSPCCWNENGRDAVMCSSTTYVPATGVMKKVVRGDCVDPDGDGLGKRKVWTCNINDANCGNDGNPVEEECSVYVEKKVKVPFFGWFGILIAVLLLIWFYRKHFGRFK